LTNSNYLTQSIWLIKTNCFTFAVREI